MKHEIPIKKPEWLKTKGNSGAENIRVTKILRELILHTVCEEAACPNCGECFGKRIATFMILGNNCTRNCRFCNVTKGVPSKVDTIEPQNIANAVKQLGLRHVVVTSVTRDDLPDGGAGQFADVISAIKKNFMEKPPVIEVLIPDFQGDFSALNKVIKTNPHIINHNMETIPRLYKDIRPMAVYSRSLELLKRVKEVSPNTLTKSGVMVGLGENFEELMDVFLDLRKQDCDILTIGQYLAPSKSHYPVINFIHPDIFKAYKKQALGLGFKYVASAPLVRSSHMADLAYDVIFNTTLQISQNASFNFKFIHLNQPSPWT